LRIVWLFYKYVSNGVKQQNILIMKKSTLLFTFATALVGTTLFAQPMPPMAPTQNTDVPSHNVAISIPEIAILDIETTENADVTFELNADNLEAGQEFIINESNSDLWINYTSVVIAAATQRFITVESNSVPSIAGLTLKVIASAHAGIGGGTVGAPTAIVTPSSTPANIITEIGSAFTGNGNSNGHNLTYHLDFTGDFADLNVSDAASTIAITYTILD